MLSNGPLAILHLVYILSNTISFPQQRVRNSKIEMSLKVKLFHEVLSWDQSDYKINLFSILVIYQYVYDNNWA